MWQSPRMLRLYGESEERIAVLNKGNKQIEVWPNRVGEEFDVRMHALSRDQMLILSTSVARLAQDYFNKAKQENDPVEKRRLHKRGREAANIMSMLTIK